MALDPVLRLAVLQRDNESCTECGKSNIPLEAHHIIPIKYGGEDLLENLRALCRKCHRRLEPTNIRPENANKRRKSVTVLEDTYNRIAAFGKTGMSFEDTLQIVLARAEETSRFEIPATIRSTI